MNIDDIIKTAVEKTNGTDQSIQEAVNMILGGNNVTAGTQVAVLHDETYPADGVKGKVKGPSSKGSGWVDVEMPNGVVLPLQTSLLVPV